MNSRRIRCPECDELFVLYGRAAERDRVECPTCGLRLDNTVEAGDDRPRSRRRERCDDEPPRRSRKQSSGMRTVLLVLGVFGFLIAAVVGVGVYFLVRAFGPEDSQSPVPLLQARAGHQTKLIPTSYTTDGPAAVPPAGTFKIVRYPSPAGQLAAYLTADPGSGTRYPAIVWAHGGFGGIGAEWDQGDAPMIFRKAGLVVMCPSWRGENDNPGKYEMFYGEVDDAVAAVDYVSKLPYVDPKRAYMAGHSTGGTITLLTAEASDKLRAAFSFGGAPDMGSLLNQSFGLGYGNTPFNWRDKKERRLRSAIDYTNHLRTPTFYFEGEYSTDYIDDARKMEKIAKKAGVPFQVFIIDDGDHFDIVEPLCKMIARKITADVGPTCAITVTANESQRSFELQVP